MKFLVTDMLHSLFSSIIFKSTRQLLKDLKGKYNEEPEVKFFGEEVGLGLNEFERKLICGPMEKRGYALDIGCGCGREAIALAKLGFRVKAIDISTPMVESAEKIAKKEGVNIDFEVRCITEIDYDNEFDYCIFSSGVYNSIPTKELRIEVIKKAMRALKSSGNLFLPIGIARRNIFSRGFFIDTIRKILRFFPAGKLKTEPGDTLISQISPYSGSSLKVFHHFFYSFKQIEAELLSSGFNVTSLKPGLWELTRK